MWIPCKQVCENATIMNMKTENILKKTSLIIMVLALCANLIACTYNENEQVSDEIEADAQVKEQFEVWTFYDRNIPGYYYRFMLDDIAEEYGVTLDVKNYSSDDMDNKLSLALVTGELPDIFMTPGGELVEDFIDNGVCAQLDMYLSDVNLYEDYDYTYTDGKHYVIPCMVKNYGVCYYDTKLMKEIGVDIPKTWEEFYELNDKVKKYNEINNTDYSTISFGEKDGYEGMLLYDMLTINAYTEEKGLIPDGNVEMGKEIHEKSVQKVDDLLKAGVFSDDYMETGDEEAITNFINHRSLMLVNQSAILSHLIWNMGDDFKVGVLPGAYSKDGRYALTSLNSGAMPGLCINSGCEDQQLAGEICVEYLKRVNEQNVKLGYASMLYEEKAKDESFLTRRIEMNRLIENAAGNPVAPMIRVKKDLTRGFNTISKDYYGGLIDKDEFMKALVKLHGAW